MQFSLLSVTKQNCCHSISALIHNQTYGCRQHQLLSEKSSLLLDSQRCHYCHIQLLIMSSFTTYKKLERTSEDLVEEDLDVVDSQWLLRHNDTMQVALHQFHGDVAVVHRQGCAKWFTLTFQQSRAAN